jgi:hypothetical protein
MQPGVCDRFSQCPLGDVLQLDENGRVAIEVRNREAGSGLRGEHRSFSPRSATRTARIGPSSGAASPNRLISVPLVASPGRGTVTAMAETAATAPLLTNRFQQAFPPAAEVQGRQVRKGTQIPTWRT